MRASSRVAAIAAGIVLAVLALDRLFPPDLSRWRDRSAIVLAGDRRPLNVFPAADGQMRLAAAPEAVDPLYLRLLIAAEDKRFFSHPGVDPLALARALWQCVSAGRVVSGGSTLTMQVARLLEPRRRTLGAKLIETARALQLEARFSKREILSMYLTLAPFGGNVEGVRTAALAWLDREPATLTPGEAALLVALPQSPERLRPDRHPGAAADAVRRLLDRMVAAGVLSAAEAAAAAAQPIATAMRLPRLAPHFSRHLARQGGEWHSSVDALLQARVEQVARQEATWLGGGAVALLVVEMPERRVRAWVGSPGLDAPAGHVDMVLARRSPGSTLKPFIYGLAFDEGLVHPATMIDDRPRRFGGYMPRNFDRGFQGLLTVREALQQSLNLPAVALLDELGPQRFLDRMTAAGLTLSRPASAWSPGLAMALGGVGVSLRDLVAGYAAIAGGGTALPLLETAGTVSDTGTSLMTPEAAAAVTAILADGPRPDAVVAGTAGGDSRRVAFKTGTSYGFRDAWAIGWSRSHVVGVWVGRPDGTPRPGATGRGAAAPILFRVMDLLPRQEGLIETAATPPMLLQRAAPPALAEFASRRDEPERAASLGITFPVGHGEIQAADESGEWLPVPLQATGGTPPYRWYVDGQPLADAAPGGTQQWRPQSEGFARLTVVDEAGRSAAVTTRIVRARSGAGS